MSTKTRIAFACYAAVALLLAAAGIRYASAPEIMSYHQRATGVAWSELTPGVQRMFLTFLEADGVGMLTTALALALLLAIPFRRGERWARGALTAVALFWLLPTLYLASRLAAATGAPTPWSGLVLLVLLVIGGFFLSADLGRGGRSD